MCSLPEVRTKLGVIRGLQSEDGTYDMYLGIPYGKVDKKNPFGLSKPHPKFEDVYEANDDSYASPQEEEFNNTIIGTLDCLRINIYVPKNAKKTPVLFYIHGGKFEIGFGGRYFLGPKFFMKHNIIVVTMNYRLGPYGFISLNTPKVPGNQGIRDALMALRWANDNIESFGGDRDDITLCGHSAGAVIADLFMTREEELFNKVILMSGSYIRPGVITPPDRTMPIKLAKEIGFITDDNEEALDFLVDVDPKNVIKAYNDIGIRLFPCIEKKFDGIEQMIPDDSKLLIKKKVKNIPILIGNCTSEMMVIFYNKSVEYLKNMNIFDVNLKKIIKNDEDRMIDERIVRKFYIGDDDDETDDLMWKFTDFQSDLNFVYPIQRRIKDYVDKGVENMYYYNFDYNGGRNFLKKKFNMVGGGTSHADELPYLFDVSFDKDMTDDDQLMIDRLTTMWVNFVKYGNPTPAITELLPVKWEPVTAEKLNYLNIDKVMRCGRNPQHTRMAFWDLFYTKYEDLC